MPSVIAVGRKEEEAATFLCCSFLWVQTVLGFVGTNSTGICGYKQYQDLWVQTVPGFVGTNSTGISLWPLF